MLSFRLTLLILTFSLAAVNAVHAQHAAPQQFLNERKDDDSIRVSFYIQPDSTASLLSKYKVFLASPSLHIAVATMKVSDLRRLKSVGIITNIQVSATPHEELTTGAFDLTLNRINLVHALFPALRGDALSGLVKERLFDTTDIDLAGRTFRTGLENESVTSHASLMATIIAGAANTSHEARGGADRARLGSTSFTNLFPDPDSLIRTKNISLQNHSYGTLVENFYGNEAAAYDAQVVANPFLVHVFSSGNSGNMAPADGPYAGTTGMANLTGNFKQAKNILTVGSIDSSGGSMPLSSRGPAYDGRIKPELMAYGEDGSSGAAALVSAAAFLVQDACRQQTGNLPRADLVRAILINSADDIGPAGPDYSNGFGSLNAYRAVLTGMNKRFLSGSLLPGAQQRVDIVVPSGLRRMKVSLSWIDKESAPNTRKALVNDLDLEVQGNSNIFLPWVPDPTPGRILLQEPAQRKLDTLNTSEQVTIDTPAPGTYSILIKADRLTTQQSFAIAWQFDTASQFQWSYPSGEPQTAGTKVWLRWETQLTGTGTIEMARRGGNWITVGQADLNAKFFTYTLPTTTGKAVLRMRLQDGSQMVSDSFVIGKPLFLSTGFNCDSFQLYWNAVAPSYKLYELTNGYLTAFANTTDTTALLNKTQHPSSYYAVAPLFDGAEGIRSQTLNYKAGATGCYFTGFFLSSQNGQHAIFSVKLGSLFQVEQLSLEQFDGNNWLTVTTIRNPTTTDFQLESDHLSQGENRFRLRLLASGKVLYSDVEKVYYLPEGGVLFYPNPVRQGGSLSVLINESGRYSMEVFDLQGRKLLTRKLNETLFHLPANFLAKGLYLIVIYDSKGKPFTRKLIVN